MESPLKRRRIKDSNTHVSYQENNVYTTIKLEKLKATDRFNRNDSIMTEYIDYYETNESIHEEPTLITKYNQIYKNAYVYRRDGEYYIKRIQYKPDLSGVEEEDDDKFKKSENKTVKKFSFLGDIDCIVYPTDPFITETIDVYVQICVQRCGIGHYRFF